MQQEEAAAKLAPVNSDIVCVCACVCARARVCVCVCACACKYACCDWDILGKSASTCVPQLLSAAFAKGRGSGSLLCFSLWQNGKVRKQTLHYFSLLCKGAAQSAIHDCPTHMARDG